MSQQWEDKLETLDRWTDTWANTFVVCSSILNWMQKPDYGGMRCLHVGFLNIPYLIKENKSLGPLPLTFIWYIRIQQMSQISAHWIVMRWQPLNFHRPFLCFWRKKCIYSVGERRCSEMTFGSAAFSSQSFWTSVIEVSDVFVLWGKT